MRFQRMSRVALVAILAVILAVGVTAAPVFATDDGTMTCPICEDP